MFLKNLHFDLHQLTLSVGDQGALLLRHLLGDLSGQRPRHVLTLLSGDVTAGLQEGKVTIR